MQTTPPRRARRRPRILAVGVAAPCAMACTMACATSRRTTVESTGTVDRDVIPVDASTLPAKTVLTLRPTQAVALR